MFSLYLDIFCAPSVWCFAVLHTPLPDSFPPSSGVFVIILFTLLTYMAYQQPFICMVNAHNYL